MVDTGQAYTGYEGLWSKGKDVHIRISARNEQTPYFSCGLGETF
jgi:hypothetical protein